MQVLRFLAKWRFCTIEHLFRDGIFDTATTKFKTAYRRLYVLGDRKLIRSRPLPAGQLFYHLLPRGGEMIGLTDDWYSLRYRCAPSTIIKELLKIDFALAMNVKYLSQREVLARLMEADYGALAGISRTTDVFYEKDGLLHVLVMDTRLTTKYFQERVKAYAKLPPASIAVVFLTFSEAKKEQALRLAAGSAVQVKVLKSKWKY